MELDDLKYQLKQRLEQPESDHSAAHISLLLKKRTHSVLDKLSRSLQLEIYLSLTFGAVFTAIAILSNNWTQRIYYSTFLIVLAFFGGFPYYLIKRIKKLGYTPLPVRSNLSTIHAIISRYVKRCYRVTMLLIPVCLAYSLWLHYLQNDSVLLVSFTVAVALYAGCSVAIAVPVHYITRWYLQKLYGAYLKQLQEQIEELQLSDV